MDIGRLLLISSVLLGFLSIGITLAIFKMSGKDCLDKELFIRDVIFGIRIFEYILINFMEIPSIPVALFVFNDVIIDSISCSYIDFVKMLSLLLLVYL